MALAMLPPSGRGVAESVALDQAPLTRRAPPGSLLSDCPGVEKPASWETLEEAAFWPQAGKVADTTKPARRRKNAVIRRKFRRRSKAKLQRAQEVQNVLLGDRVGAAGGCLRQVFEGFLRHASFGGRTRS